MQQPVPTVTIEDVRRVVAREFAGEEVAVALDAIDRLEVREHDRIALACLKLANGDLQRLLHELADAPGYWREKISEAEYPASSKKRFHWERLSDDEKADIYTKDWKQYSEWLVQSRPGLTNRCN